MTYRYYVWSFVSLVAVVSSLEASFSKQNFFLGFHTLNFKNFKFWQHWNRATTKFLSFQSSCKLVLNFTLFNFDAQNKYLVDIWNKKIHSFTNLRTVIAIPPLSHSFTYRIMSKNDRQLKRLSKISDENKSCKSFFV